MSEPTAFERECSNYLLRRQQASSLEEKAEIDREFAVYMRRKNIRWPEHFDVRKAQAHDD